MNTVKKCSISGIAFTLEADAYEALENYLETLRKQYAGEKDGEEIVADIEARIAELLLSTQDGSRIVELPLIQNIIAQMGSAEQIDRESHDDEPQGGKTARPEQPRIPRRLYRNPEGARLGGVCSGLANYFDTDPVWIRLGFFAPFVLMILFRILHTTRLLNWAADAMGNLFLLFMVGYLIMWFVVPTARTARQKLEMKGEKITAQSIRQETAATDRSDVDGYSKSVAAGTVSALGLVLLALLKVIAGVIVFGLIVLACALVIGIFAVSVSGVPAEFFGWSLLNWTWILGILIVLIPCLLLIYVLMCLIASRRPSGKATLWVFLLWVLSFVGLAIAGVCECSRASDKPDSRLSAPAYNPANLLNDVAEQVENALEGLDSQEGPDSVSMQLSVHDGQNTPVQVELKVSKTDRQTK